MRIDAHQHLWLYSPETHGWINDEMEIIRRNFLPNDISYTLKKNRIDGVVAVQASESLDENKFLMEMAGAYAMIKGIVGWVDFADPEIEARLQEYAQTPIMKGFRHIIEADKDPDYLIRDDFLKGIELLGKYGFTYDLLIKPIHFKGTRECVQQYPDQKFVLDHIAKPNVKNKEFGEWAQFIENLSGYQNVYCKISGLVTEAEWNTWETSDFEQYIAHAVASFGMKRLMFGSDWPVSLLSTSYEDWLNVCESFFKNFSEEDKAMFWGGNAVKFYGLK